jgi:hypothetical protein
MLKRGWSIEIVRILSPGEFEKNQVLYPREVAWLY